MRPWPVLAVLLLAAQLAQAQDGKPREFRDCDTCPLMVETPTGMAIGKFPVTRGEYRAFAEATRLESVGCILRIGKDRSEIADASWLKPGYEQTDDHPVVCVSWLEATAYADWLSEKTGRSYRLPTLEESAAAAAGGATTKYWWGDSFGNACRFANVADAEYKAAFPADDQPTLTCDDGYAYTSPVGAFPANGWGLHDMAGNVWNWTNSCLKGDCANAIFRGAGWDVPWPDLFASDASFGDRIVLRNDVIGFRVLRER
jgi:formylglycine-generating enzyme required for sulfatase activity